MNTFNSSSKRILFILLLVASFKVYSQGRDSIPVKNQADTLLFAKTDEGLNEQLVFHITSMDFGSIDLNGYVQILKEISTEHSPETIRNPELNRFFKKFQPDAINCDRCIYWGKIILKNDTKSRLSNWILYFGKASYINAYVFDQRDISVSHQKTGRFVAANSKKLKMGNRLERIVLNFSENEELTVYFRIKNASGYLPELSVKLASEDFYKTQQYAVHRIRDGLFIGFLLAIIIFNLIYFFTTRDVAFFYQFLFVSGVLIFLLDIMNFICDVPILRDHPILFEPINFAALILLNISYLKFVQKFIQLDKVFSYWMRTINRLIYMNLFLGLLIIVYYIISLNELISDTAMAIVSAIQYATLLIFLIQLIKTKDKKIFFILIATFFLITGVIVDGICVSTGIGVPVAFSEFVILGNVSFFFFGLAYRMKLMKEEEHEAIRLKENQELKNKLYANITHEFRTPLTVIQGMAQHIEGMVKTQESSKIHNALQLIKSNGSRLLKLVNTILDLAKMESGKMELNLSHGDIIAYLRYAIQSFESYADSKKISIHFLTELEIFKMDFDKEKIQQIISNLISNAIKFTPTGGRIYFSFKVMEVTKNRLLQFEVKDTGEGIPASELGNVFNRFFQVTDSSHKSQGSGMGLAFVQELVNLMGGKISVESELGRGSVFKVQIPIPINIPRDSEIDRSTNDLQENKDGQPLNESIDLFEPQYVNLTESLLEVKTYPQEFIQIEKPQLLIVDDNKDIIYYLQTLLEKAYTIEIAYNGQDGISLALEIIPDLIISDVMMPDKDGYELCEILKNDERTSHIPIILLTAKIDTKSRIAGIKKGADAYLIKPFDEIELMALLENLLSIRKSLQEHYKLLENRPVSGENSSTIEDAFLVKLNTIIQDNMEDEDFGIFKLCRAMQMSRTQLHRKITALTGKSTSIYIRSLKLQKAKQLLKKPEFNISEIAFAVGFSDPNYFTRTFTEEFGITPSGFRSGS